LYRLLFCPSGNWLLILFQQDTVVSLHQVILIFLPVVLSICLILSSTIVILTFLLNEPSAIVRTVLV